MAPRSSAQVLDEERRGQVLPLVLRHGWNATAFQTLEYGYHYFFVEDGVVAYRDTGRAWVAAGAPLCAEERMAETTLAFASAAREAGRGFCFVAVEERFLDRTGLPAFAIGEQPVWDPLAWSATLAQARGLREQLRRARKKGVRVRPLSPAEMETPAVRAALDALTRAWLASRRLPELDFMVRVELGGHPALRRIFVAEQGERWVAAAALVPVPTRAGWLLEDLLRVEEAPNGTSELLFDAALRACAAEGSRFLTAGLVPLRGDVSLGLRWARKLAAPFYDFEGLARFRTRLRPTHWDPIYLAHDGASTRALVETLRLLGGGSLTHLVARAALNLGG